MTKTPPSRQGIRFEVGALLEARDSQENWYCSSIEKIDYEREKVLIHYRQWSHRHDEWFDWNSAYLRPLERVQLRREGLQEAQPRAVFRVREHVQACWSDCRFYPARILQVNKDDSYTVKFYDGVVKKVKATKVKPLEKTAKTRQTDRTLEKNKSEQSARRETGPAGSDASDPGGESEEGDRNDEDGHRKRETPPVTKGRSQPAVSKRRRTKTRRKRTGSSSRLPNAKRKRPDSNKVTSSRSQTPQARPDSVPDASALSSAPTAFTERAAEASADTESEPKPQVHLPTTHKYSREPLYRVIKNQPPPILSIELDHNPFKCQAPGCTKSFRKGSLLQYHIKYYHDDCQPADGSQAAGQETPRRTHPLAEGRSFFSERRKENRQQNNNHLHDAKEKSAMETGLKIEQKRERKLKKNKKKRSKPEERGESLGSAPTWPQAHRSLRRPPLSPGVEHDKHRDEEGSDWSTASAEWSEEEELDVTTPMSQQSSALATEDRDIVRCVCEVDEEDDFMIQCDQCLCWQHGACMGLLEDNVPEVYICYACRETAGQRRSHRYRYDGDWLSDARMFGLSFVEDNYSERNASKMAATRRLLGDVQQLFLVLQGLQLKINILQTEAHPDLKLWKQPWKQGEGPETRPLPTANEDEETASGPAPYEKTTNRAAASSPQHMSYISSEHCYQKPAARYYPAALAVRRGRGSDLEHSLRRSEELIYSPAETQAVMITTTTLHSDKEVELQCGGEKNLGQLMTEEAEPDTPVDAPCEEARRQWQSNLLDHIQALQNQLTHRMDLIERELDGLEYWLDQSGELEPPDPLSHVPQLKQRIRRLQTDLGTVQRVSLCCSSGGRR